MTKPLNATLLSVLGPPSIEILLNFSSTILDYQGLLLAFTGNKELQSYKDAESRVAVLVDTLQKITDIDSRASIIFHQALAAFAENKKLLGACNELADKIEELTGKTCKEVMEANRK